MDVEERAEWTPSAPSQESSSEREKRNFINFGVVKEAAAVDWSDMEKMKQKNL